MVFAADRVNGGGNHFATTAEESQYIDEFLVLPAQPRTNNLGILAVFSKQFDGLAKRNRLIGGDSGALLCLRQARVAVRRVRGASRGGQQACQQDQCGEAG